MLITVSSLLQTFIYLSDDSTSTMSESGNYGRQRLLADELFDYCYPSDLLLSEEGLRQIIERHGFITNHHVVSDYDFFLVACINKKISVGIIQCLLEYFPDAASATDKDERSPLHCACINPNVTLDIIQLLIDANPASVRCEDNDGNTPLHYLCDNGEVDEATALEILKLLIEKYPEVVRHANNDRGGRLPIHKASRGRSPEFCCVMIEAYPGSEQITDGNGLLPLHHACTTGSLATVEYLHNLFPYAINRPCTDGLYPIHCAISGIFHRNNPTAAVEVVKFLLDCDPNQKLRRGVPVFHFACLQDCDVSNIEAGIQIIKILFDVHPVAIELHNRNSTDIQLYHEQVQSFINGELVYARQAGDHRLMITTDDNGQLPLHRALQNNVRLGSIKLLMKGNPSAVRSVDDRGAFPLHVACEHHDSTNVVDYILGLSPHITRDAIDSRGNTTLHCACRGAKYDTIALLVEKYGAVSITKRNTQGKLPIDMLWESNEVGDRESVEYMGSVFQLLKAYPDMMMNVDARAIQIQNGTGNGKKRKYGNE